MNRAPRGGRSERLNVATKCEGGVFMGQNVFLYRKNGASWVRSTNHGIAVNAPRHPSDTDQFRMLQTVRSQLDIVLV